MQVIFQKSKAAEIASGLKAIDKGRAEKLLAQIRSENFATGSCTTWKCAGHSKGGKHS